MIYADDNDCWDICKPEHLWIFDKLIVAKKLGHVAGPAGVPVPVEGDYVVRPIMNLKMMSRGASIKRLTPELSLDETHVPDGFFWQEQFEGRHLSVDYLYGKQTLCVEGFRKNGNLARFSMWKKVSDVIQMPAIFEEISKTYQWLNLELVDGKVIEAHLRFNDDFANHDYNTIIPVWKDTFAPPTTRAEFYPSPCGDRLGFWIYNGPVA